jgi:hypothetical protein
VLLLDLPQGGPVRAGEREAAAHFQPGADRRTSEKKAGPCGVVLPSHGPRNRVLTWDFVDYFDGLNLFTAIAPKYKPLHFSNSDRGSGDMEAPNHGGIKKDSILGRFEEIPHFLLRNGNIH